MDKNKKLHETYNPWQIIDVNILVIVLRIWDNLVNKILYDPHQEPKICNITIHGKSIDGNNVQRISLTPLDFIGLLCKILTLSLTCYFPWWFLIATLICHRRVK